jgi:hypothetical protein
MKRIISNVTKRHACPFNPATPQVDLVEGQEFDVSDALADLLVESGGAKLVVDEDVPSDEKLVEKKGKK